MTDDTNNTQTSSGHAVDTGKASTTPAPAAPPGFTFRRSTTVDETAQFRRRPLPNLSTADKSFEPPRRRSSTFSDYSLNETKKNLRDEILNPGGLGMPSHDGSNWASVPLVFALLPAVGGILFKNGSAVVTDVMLLGLAAVFLHWSVTQPW
jgi:hypothetical protein